MSQGPTRSKCHTVCRPCVETFCGFFYSFLLGCSVLTVDCFKGAQRNIPLILTHQSFILFNCSVKGNTSSLFISTYSRQHVALILWNSCLGPALVFSHRVSSSSEMRRAEVRIRQRQVREEEGRRYTQQRSCSDFEQVWTVLR